MDVQTLSNSWRLRATALAGAMLLALTMLIPAKAAVATVDLTVRASQNPLIVTTAGQPVDIRVRVTATGKSPRVPAAGTATSVIMVAQVPPHININSVTWPAGWQCQAAGQTVTCTKASLVGGTNALFKIAGTAIDLPPDGQDRTTATVSSAEKDAYPADNFAIAAATLP
ncbi:hypothetical protein AYO38_05390 [bacterium SCGC AG-212-C10]|nr:hypothetical protein AYO38_05390 [bacterium SCGC AG-212-C10]